MARVVLVAMAASWHVGIEAVTIPSALGDADVCAGQNMDDVIARYAPEVYFHEKERYFPVSVEDFLAGSELRDPSHNIILHNVDVNTDLEVHSTGQENFLHLRNTNPATTDDWQNAVYHGDTSGTAPMYVSTVVEQDFVNVNYHILHAYSGPQTGEFHGEFFVPGAGQHQGDWEGFSVKLDRSCNRAKAYGYKNHGDIEWFKPGSQGVEWSTHAKVYSSLHTHATYNHAGRFTKHEVDLWLLGTVSIGDLTMGSNQLGNTPFRPREYVYLNAVRPKWVEFTGRWGSVNDNVPAGTAVGVYNPELNALQQAASAGQVVADWISGHGDTTGPDAPWHAGTWSKVTELINGVDPYCARGSETVSTSWNADIGGCGMENCEDRYTKDTTEKCWQHCWDTPGCNAYSFELVPNQHPICTIYSHTGMNQIWTNQVLCRRLHCPAGSVFWGTQQGQLTLKNFKECGFSGCMPHVPNIETCMHMCQLHSNCRRFTWTPRVDIAEGPHHNICTLSDDTMPEPRIHSITCNV